jgi:hypothetical protein
MSQANLTEVFNNLKSVLSEYEGDLNVVNDLPGRYELEFDKEIETRSRRTGNIIKKKSLYFAGIIIQKDYVGLYFMPIYSHKEDFRDLSDDFMKKLKGKSCFHIRKIDPDTEKETRVLVKRGYELYRDIESFA